MLSNKIKRCFSLFMAIFMLISLMPASAFAAGEEDHDHSHESSEQAAENTNESDETELPAEDVPPATVNPAIAEFQERIDTIMASYFGGADATAEEIKAAVDAMDDETFLNWCYIEVLMLEEDLMWAYEDGVLSESEVTSLADANPMMPVAAGCVYDRAARMESDATVYTLVTILDGKVTLSDTQNNGSGDAAQYKATAKGGLLSKTTNTITITNASGKPGSVSFGYSVSKASSYNVAGVTNSTSGTITRDLAAGDTITISVTSNSGFSNTTVTLTLTNITFEEAAESSNVTVAYDSTLGSVTAGGAAAANGTVLEVSRETGVTLVATPVSGVAFLGWINQATNERLSTETTYTLTPVRNMTVQPVFAKADKKAWFLVGAKLYDDLNVAATAAGSGGIVTLAYNGTLPAGDYTIPSNCTLLIPFDATGTVYTTEPGRAGTTYTQPTVFRKLIMAAGAKITVNGSISISAKVITGKASKPAGSPVGPCGFIDMKEGSSITLNSGAKLYAWGFITGKGTVLAKSGASVYECFQFMDFRGGSQTTGMKNEVFPLSQYYVQNIEAPLTLESGATEKVVTCLEAASVTAQPGLTFIASKNAFFSLSSGSVTKWYDGSTDRLHIEINGTGSISPISLKVGFMTINSNDYILPINGNITLTIKNGASLSVAQAASVLPGGQIIVESGATCSINDGKALYFYDADQWGTYCGSENKTFFPVQYAPGRTYTRTAADLVDASAQIDGHVDASAGFVYTTEGGANVFSTGTGTIDLTPGTATITYQLIQVSNNNNWVQIPVTPAKLKNADGSFVETAQSARYAYADGKWAFRKCDEGQCVAGAAATCTTPATCTKCFSVVTPALGHAFGDVTYSPTVDDFVAGTHTKCTATRSCTRDGCEYSETAEADITTTNVSATCIDAEYNLTAAIFLVGWAETQEYGREYVEGSEPLPHRPAYNGSDPIYIEHRLPNCREEGYAKYECSFCKQVVEETLPVDTVNGHSRGNQGKDASGHWFVCAYGCGYKYPTEAHTPGADETCTTDQVCTICDYVITAAHHTEEEIPAVPATCTAAGSTAGVKCSVCKEILTAPTTVAAPGHTFGDVTPANAATCEAAGNEAHKQCTVCNKYFAGNAAATATDGKDSAAAFAIAQKDHSYTGEIKSNGDGKDATHSFKCVNGCDAYGGAVNHTWNAGVVDPAATCTTAGTKTYTCTVTGCGATYTEEVAATGHTFETIEANAATCLEGGNVAHKYCSVCKQYFAADAGTDSTEGKANADEFTIAANGHTFVNEVTAKDATCGADGNYAYKQCDTCKLYFAGDAEKNATGGQADTSSFVIRATGEHEVKLDKSQGTNGYTWTENGDAYECTVYGKCDNCDYTETEKVTATGETKQEATCMQGGKITYTATFTAEWLAENEKTQTMDVDTPIDGDAHKWQDADCNNPKMCELCGDEEGEALGHVEIIIPGTDSTCSEDGLSQGTKCSRCGEILKEQVSIPATGHSYTSSVTTAASCTTAGVKTYTCNGCGDIYTEEIDPTGHQNTTTTTVEATCTEAGSTTVTCDDCGATLSTTELPTVAHSYQNAVDAQYLKDAATCTAAAVYYKSCSVCGAQGTETFINGNPLDHSFGDIVPAKQPTCTQNGNHAYKQCTSCELYFASEAEPNATGGYDSATAFDIAAQAHVMVGQEGYPATCTEPGLEAGEICEVCGSGKQVIPALGHDFGEIVAAQDSTCKEYGHAAYKPCKNCNLFFAENAGTDSTDGKADADSFKYEKLAAHTEGAVVVENEVAATCTAEGSYDDVVYCTVCNAELSRNTVTVDKIAHDYDAVVTAPTCTAKGYTTYTCTACGDSYVADETEMVAHTPAEAVEENRAASTCTVAGSYESVVYCSECNTELSRETKALELAAHTEGAVVVENEVAATCTAEGSYDNVVYCTVCNAELSRNTVTVDKIAHDYDAVVTAPTCTAKGYTTYTCSACGDSYVSDETEMAAHTPAAAVEENRVESTCTVAGSYESVVYCSVCGEELSRETKALELAAHTEGAVVVENEVAATCTAEGSYDNVVYCTVCNAELSRNTVTVEKIAHAYEAVVTAPTCTAKGYTTYTCTCGDSYKDDYVEAKQHADTNKDHKCDACGTAVSSCDESEQTVVYDHVDSTNTHTVRTTCNVCQNQVGEVITEDCADESGDGKCDKCGASMVLIDPSLTLYRAKETNPYATMMAGNEIKISVNVAKINYSYTDYYVEFQINNNGIKTTKALPSINSNSSYANFHFSVPAPLMTETISATVYGVKDGVVYCGRPVQFTVRESVFAQMDNVYKLYTTNAKAKKQFDLLLSLLKYGAEAQLRFKKNTDNLATDGLKEEYAALIKTDAPEFRSYPTADENGKAAVLYNMSLMLQEKINMYGNFKVMSGFTELSEYAVEIVHKKGNDETVSYTISGDDLSWNGSYITFYFSEIAPSQMRDEMAITLYKNGEAVSATYTRTGDMIANKALANASSTALRDAIMNYADFAKVYFD